MPPGPLINKRRELCICFKYFKIRPSSKVETPSQTQLDLLDCPFNKNCFCAPRDSLDGISGTLGWIRCWAPPPMRWSSVITTLSSGKHVVYFYVFIAWFTLSLLLLFSAVFPNFTMNDTTELLDNWDNFEEPILEIDFEENVVADQGIGAL